MAGMNYKVIGGKPLSGSVTTNVSKNAIVALLAASLLNRGTTTIKHVPKIEEAHRIIEVLKSIGVEVGWVSGDVVVRPPKKLTPEKMDREAAGKTRSTVLFTAPLAHLFESFEIPLPGGCKLGGRTMMPHIQALGALGIEILSGSEGMYKVSSHEKQAGEIAMYESSDTGTESVLMAAAKIPGKTIIKYASANYMVQDLCTFLEACGVKVEGIGTSTLVVHGVDDIDRDVTVYPSEDPIESMFFISLAATAGSELTIKRCPMDFLELELVTLGQMSQKYEYGPTKLHAADIEAPPALRPATIILIGMLAAEGESMLREVYPINRGYERLHERLTELGASVEAVE